MSDHSTHGRGTAEGGPDESACGCADTTLRDACAAEGCGFCKAAQARSPCRELAEGWAWPLNLAKAHHFDKGDVKSLCGRVMYLGSQREQGNDGSPDNCAECKKRLAKRSKP